MFGGMFFGQGDPGFLLPVAPSLTPPLAAVPVITPYGAVSVVTPYGATMTYG